MQLFVRINDVHRAVNVGLESLPGDILSSLCSTSNPGPSYAGLVFKHRGRELRGSLSQAGVEAWDVLDLVPRVLGGGGDGGTTGAESRSCYLEMYLGKKHDKVNPDEERLARWTTCHLTGQPLQSPIVADELGNLFNKEALLHALLSKSLPPGLKHIQGLKHVVELKLESSGSNGASRFACPVTGLDFNGKARFLVHFKTGQVVSERAWKEVPKVVEELVGAPSVPEAWVPINPAGEEAAALLSALAARREAQKTSRKERRAANGAAAANGGEGSAAAVGTKRPAPPATLQPSALRLKESRTSELAPANADKKIWNSIFTHASGLGPAADGYMLRGTASRGMKMA